MNVLGGAYHIFIINMYRAELDVRRSPMYVWCMVFLGKLTKTCAYSICYGFGYLWFEGEGSDMIALHPLVICI